MFGLFRCAGCFFGLIGCFGSLSVGFYGLVVVDAYQVFRESGFWGC